jgi:outer membrane protein OmpA-like peptidoglycan-associated protein
MSDSPLNLKSPQDSDPPERNVSKPPLDSIQELRNIILGEDFDDRLEAVRITPKTVANLLPEAITLTHSQSEPMVDALRPTVEDTIKESISQDQEILADTLFPVIGPATRKAVTTAIKNLTDSLNQGLEMSLSPQSVGWRIEAWRTGRSFAEVVLLRSLLFQVEQVLLIHKETGLMLKDIDATQGREDPELVSAMLTAIEDFVQDSFRTNQNGPSFLDSVEIGELNLWIEGAPRVVLACVIRGNAPTSLRNQMKEVIERIQRQYEPMLKSFSGDRTPFEATQTLLETCLISQTKPSPPKKRSPLFWITGALLIGLLIFLARNTYSQYQWKSALNALEQEPGITLLKTKRGWSSSRIEGLRDPLAKSPRSILENYDVGAEKISLQFEPYWSLAPKLLEDHAQRTLAPPPGVKLTYDPETLTLSLTGKASEQWIATAKQLAQTQPRINSVETQQLETLEIEKLLKLKGEVESITFNFQEGSSEFNATEKLKFEKLAQTLATMIQLSKQIQQPITIHIRGQSSPTGQFEDNARLSQSRADLIMRRLTQKGISPQLIKAQGIGVTSNSTKISTTPKAQVSFQIDLPQP